MKTIPDVLTYYRHTRFDYRVIWDRSGVPALHFGYYDEQADKHAKALLNMNRVMAQHAGIRKNEQVLDAGCGVGQAAFWLTENAGAQVTGLSVVPEQIADARRTAAKKKVPVPTFVVGDFLSLPFPEAQFDVVWACESFCHAQDKARFFVEARRVLKPGGRLIIADYIRTARPLNDEQERLIREWLHPQAIPDIGTAAEYETHALAAGFSRFTAKDITPNVRVSLRNLHHLCEKWRIPGQIMRTLGLVSQIRYQNVLASIRQYEAMQAGAWQYALMLGEVTPDPAEISAPDSTHIPL
ncbi:MAG: class I SAM-dependent methyltransferase [Saprospiraceae bacterium]